MPCKECDERCEKLRAAFETASSAQTQARKIMDDEIKYLRSENDRLSNRVIDLERAVALIARD